MSAPEQDPTFAQLRDLLALVADADPATIGPETRPADLAHWSSLTFIVLMAGIDKRFGIRMDPARAVQAETAGALASLIRAHPAGAARDG